MKRGVPRGWGAGLAESGWWIGWKRDALNLVQIRLKMNAVASSNGVWEQVK